jgi:hypothetical protein
MVSIALLLVSVWLAEYSQDPPPLTLNTRGKNRSPTPVQKTLAFDSETGKYGHTYYFFSPNDRFSKRTQ